MSHSSQNESNDPSMVWEHFTKIYRCSLSDPKMQCNHYCSSKKYGTLSMIYHVNVYKQDLIESDP